MSIYMAKVTPRERSKAGAYAAGLGTVGMLAYYLPITKGRYVQTAYNVVKNETLDDICELNKAALAIVKKNNVSPEQKIFLSRLGVAETLTDIDAKVLQLKTSITDSDVIKNLKQGFADTFDVCKKNVVARDSVSMKAFSKIRWVNFAWGTGLGVVLGYVIGMMKSKDAQLSHFE